MPDYQHLIINSLQLSRAFFVPRELQLLPEAERLRIADLVQTIREKMLSAGDAMQGEIGDIFGINLCIHVANSLVLLESTHANLGRAIDTITSDPVFSGVDPSLVLASATLYFLLTSIESGKLSKKERGTLKHIRQRFDRMNWMIGEQGMRILGINPT